MEHTGLRHEEHDVRKDVSRAMAKVLRCDKEGNVWYGQDEVVRKIHATSRQADKDIATAFSRITCTESHVL